MPRGPSTGWPRTSGWSFSATPFWGPSSANSSIVHYPEYLEGDLTKIKCVVVSRQTCAKISEALGMQEFLILGKGMTMHPTVPPSLLADVFESLAAAIYLDGGDPAAREFITAIHRARKSNWPPPASWAATTSRCCSNWPSAKTARRRPTSCWTKKGPDHSKCFKIAAQIGRSAISAAWGRNKKEAEQRAARNALAELNGEPCRFPRIDDLRPVGNEPRPAKACQRLCLEFARFESSA